MNPASGIGEEELYRTVRETALRVLEVDPEELGDDTDFETVGGSSLQRLELVSSLQNQLGVDYTLDDEVEITSVRRAVDITRRYLAD